MNKQFFDVIIIGGGASGMTTAISILKKNSNLSVAIVEKNDSLGKKLRATGNGRCNLSNDSINGVEEILDFFMGIGVLTRTDGVGRIYPYSESAGSVVTTLTNKLESLGIDILINFSVLEVQFSKQKFSVISKNSILISKYLVLSTGGKAGPAFGCSGDGYAFAQTLGHSINKTIPVLSGITCDLPKYCKGLRVKAYIRLRYDNNVIFEEDGEIQMTEYGISGIAVFNLSRHLKYIDNRNLDPYLIEVDFFNRENFEDVMRSREFQIFLKSANCLELLCSIVKKEIACLILNFCGLEESRLADTLTDLEIKTLVNAVHCFILKPKGVIGFKMAQCTSGGVPLSEIELESMESKIRENLFLTGEILDYDGPCGGYNLHFAWKTGIKVGRYIGNLEKTNEK